MLGQHCILCKSMSSVTRMCLKCGTERPVLDFPSGVCRYECKGCVWERAKKSRQRIFAANPSKRVLWYIWHRAWSDSRLVYKKDKMQLRQSDIAALFEAESLKPSMSYRIVPKDGKQKFTVSNASLVTVQDRITLAAAWRRESAEGS
jgi:hypothetical protein